ncbi:glutathione S-transferase T3-like [Brassica napus]|uniref:glutathione S-transferase T3-like n=1 Tax=Brassica napus TaxID=3708 RepID=UPI0020791391|nr:glutathione S-transferase T3-like [Brassica napus]
MDSYPFSSHSKFVELLSQQTVSFGNNEDSVDLSSSQPLPGSVGTETSNCDGDSAPQRRERRKWTPTDDVVLISSWLNTRKDHVVGNEQKSNGFWKRIAAYFGASPLLAGCKERDHNHCKHRWHRINDLVSKFCGAYEAATRKKQELRHDQKWCELATAKNDGSLKKRKCEDGGDLESSQATENKCPPGVKAAKKSSQKTVVSDDNLNKLQSETVPLSEADNESSRVRAVERGHEM